MNCVGQYELDMRGNRINVIENLGATEVRTLMLRGGESVGPASPWHSVRGRSRLCPPATHTHTPASDALQNQFDSIDLSDNAIARLEGFPKLLRLKILHLNNNRVNKMGRNLEGVPCRWRGRGVTRWTTLHMHLMVDCTQESFLYRPAASLPNLEWLMLTNNRLSTLAVSGTLCVQCVTAQSGPLLSTPACHKCYL